MKKIYIILLALSASLGIQAQVIFESDLSNWNDSTPNDWFGFKTSLEVDSAIEITTGATHGTSLVQLTNTESSHKRFTTDPLSLIEGETYEVEFWVKGNGEIRTNLFDGDLDGGDSGYGTYNPYIVVASSTVTSYVQTVSPDTTYDAMELILSLRNGVVEVDRVELRLGVPVTPVDVDIYDIQYTTAASGASPLVGTLVNTSGVVTAVTNNGYYMQEADAAWSGIYVNDFTNVPVIGDEVEVSGVVEEFFSFTTITSVSDYTVLSSGNTFAAIQAGTSAFNDEQYEGVFVRAEGFCTALTNDYAEWFIDDGSGEIMINDEMYLFEPILGLNYEVYGPVHFAFSEFKIEPRFEDDVNQVSSLSERTEMLFSLFPNPAEDILNVSLKDNLSSGELRILDALGRIVMQERVDSQLGLVDISSLQSGSYTVQIWSDTSYSISSLIVR